MDTVLRHRNTVHTEYDGFERVCDARVSAARVEAQGSEW